MDTRFPVNISSLIEWLHHGNINKVFQTGASTAIQTVFQLGRTGLAASSVIRR